MVPKWERKLLLIIFALFIAASVFFAVMIMTSNARFYDNCIKFNNTSYTYDQIDSVYYIEAVHNTSGNKIERASYVILFKDKTSLDLDGYTSIEFTEKEVLPLLRDKGFKINSAESDYDLPWY